VIGALAHPPPSLDAWNRGYHSRVARRVA
jgi:hypothetical protein